MLFCSNLYKLLCILGTFFQARSFFLSLTILSNIKIRQFYLKKKTFYMYNSL